MSAQKPGAAMNAINKAQDACQQICALIESGADFADYYKKEISRTPAEAYMPWEKIVLTAARHDNAAALKTADDYMTVMPEALIRKALLATIDNGDRRAAAHYLLHLNPHAPEDFGMLAIKANAPGVFEEFVTWSKTHIGPEKLMGYTHALRDKPAEVKAGFKTALEICSHMRFIYRSHKSLLRDQFGRAADKNDIELLVATYSEGRNAYFDFEMIRGPVNMKDKKNPHAADGILVALLHGRADFALQMVRDGYKMKDISTAKAAEVLPQLDGKMRAVYDGLLDGTIKATPIVPAANRMAAAYLPFHI